MTDGVLFPRGERAFQAAGSYLVETINMVLDFSKIEAGKFTPKLRPVRIDRVIGNVVSMLHDRATEKNLILSATLTSVPPNLFGDPHLLQQALLNYAANAIRFTDRGTVTLRALLMEETGGEALLRFEVVDTGVGVTPADLAKLFKPYEQIEHAGAEHHGGTGLGLVITRQLARLMGGDAGADAAPGGGSIFWFSARLKKNGVSAEARNLQLREEVESILRSEHGGSRILLAEDEPISREIGVALVERVGMTVDTAQDGAQAVELAQARDYDLILMDVQLPVIDGLEATRRIRRLRADSDPPIVAVTANAFAEDRERCLAAGMDDFLAKPVLPETLYAMLLRWLGRRAV